MIVKIFSSICPNFKYKHDKIIDYKGTPVLSFIEDENISGMRIKTASEYESTKEKEKAKKPNLQNI